MIDHHYHSVSIIVITSRSGIIDDDDGSTLHLLT